MSECKRYCLFCCKQNIGFQEIDAWLEEETKFFTERLKLKGDLELALQREVREVMYLKKENSQTERYIAELRKQTEAIRNFLQTHGKNYEETKATELNELIELIRTCWSPVKFRWKQMKRRRNTADLQKMIDEIKRKQKGLELVLEMAQAKLNKQMAENEMKKLKMSAPRRLLSLPSRARSSSNSSSSLRSVESLFTCD